MSVQDDIRAMGQRATQAARELNRLSTGDKNRILLAMADALEAGRGEIAAENAKDLAAGRESGLGASLLDRLELTPRRLDGTIQGLRDIVALPDPVGETLEVVERPNGLRIHKVRVPIGVIGIIYESRPNVTVDAAGLCFKASNAVILRGGKEALHSNRVLARIMAEGGRSAGMPEHAVQLVQTTDRDAVRELVQMDDCLSMVIPRGGEGLIRAVAEMSRVPVVKHYKGVCHTFVDASADLDMAWSICENAKVQRPGVCNAMETLLVHEDIADAFLPTMARRLEAAGVELRGNEAARARYEAMKPATEEDWDEEYLALVLAVRVVPSLDAALEHIARYGSQHSDAIIATSREALEAFTLNVDSAAVFVNASTRFSDGAEFGMGAEIGISTDKLHARGPMGLRELTTYKFIVHGAGQVKS